jgi:hypothetical protein
MKIFASLWSVVAIATLALAQEKPTAPKVSIEGADKPIGIGDIVVLSVKLDSQPKDRFTHQNKMCLLVIIVVQVIINTI